VSWGRFVIPAASSGLDAAHDQPWELTRQVAATTPGGREIETDVTIEDATERTIARGAAADPRGVTRRAGGAGARRLLTNQRALMLLAPCSAAAGAALNLSTR
jgi:hypothetical protein